MKICQLCAVDFTLQKFLIPLIDKMEDEGWHVTAICSDGKYIKPLRNDGYTIITVPIARSMNLLKHIISLFKLIKVFRQEKFYAVHVHTPIAALIGRAAAKIVGVPLVVYTAHGFYFHDGMSAFKKRMHIMLERLAGKYTDLLFTQSREDADTAIKENIIAANKVYAIGNGVDVKRFDPSNVSGQTELKLSLGIPGDAIVVGMIARLVKEKGVNEFLEAALSLYRENRNIYFVIIGERLESDHAKDINRVVGEASSVLAENLILTGIRSDIPQLLSIMDIYCLPSWREGMPRSIIEAMMMSKPVVATNIRGSREEVVNEETGLLVPVRDSNRLSAALKQCIDDPVWAGQLGIAGRKRALKMYDESKVIDYQVKKIVESAKAAGLNL